MFRWNIETYCFSSFSEVEKRHSTIHKEALGLAHHQLHFHQYFYGRRFTLITDHKPLEHIFQCIRQTPKIASSRLLRWAMLNSYNFNVIYQAGRENYPADSLSKQLLQVTSEQSELPDHAKLLHMRDMSDEFKDYQSPQLHQSASCNRNESSSNEVEAEEGELNNVDHSLSKECIMPRRNPSRIKKPPSRFTE
ncbi:hypothetical protein JTB14_024419 [Gonioctena quinquepunctata]|nr:hypothetical protein JTB14_024419 [Gonioctena quinquepunctata]